MKKFLGTLSAGLILAVSLSGCGAPANTVHNAGELKGKTIGTQLGTTGYIFAQDVEDAKVEGYDKGSDAIQALKQGKIDAVIIDSEPAQEFIKKNKGLQILPDAFAEEEYSIAYKKGNDELGEQIDEVLTRFKEDGTIEKIMKHWIGSDPDHIGYVPDNNIERSSVLTMATNAEFPPYESMEDGKIVGIDVDIMNAVCDELALTLKIENMDFDDIIGAVDSERVDVGVAGMSVTPEREEKVSFTQSYAVSKQVIVVRAD